MTPEEWLSRARADGTTEDELDWFIADNHASATATVTGNVDEVEFWEQVRRLYEEEIDV